MLVKADANLSTISIFVATFVVNVIELSMLISMLISIRIPQPVFAVMENHAIRIQLMVKITLAITEIIMKHFHVLKVQEAPQIGGSAVKFKLAELCI